MARWREIAIAACEQSGRSVLPALHPPVALDALSPDARTRAVLSPTARAGLHELAIDDGALCIAVGPEGGFDASELDELAAAGFRAVAFGPRVLRTETAAVSALAVAQARFGDLLAPAPSD
jgi:16S rRNA (uracil1498-N3)-methyltransferase